MKRDQHLCITNGSLTKAFYMVKFEESYRNIIRERESEFSLSLFIFRFKSIFLSMMNIDEDT